MLPTATAIFVAALLQVGLAPQMAIGGVVPNLLLLVTISLGLVEGSLAGAVGGFAAGFIFDLLGTNPIGAMALMLAVVGHLAGSLQEHMFAEGWRLPVTVVFVASFLAGLGYWIVLWVHPEMEPGFGTAIVHVILPGALYNGALALLIFPVLARFLRREHQIRTYRRLA